VLRSLRVTIHITSVVDDPDSRGSKPQINFVGVMTAPSTSTLNGHVTQMADGSVRWHFVCTFVSCAILVSEPDFVRFPGTKEMLFGGLYTILCGIHADIPSSSEGVSIGGLHSRFGVLGIWTTIFHELDDPVGMPPLSLFITYH
jgi:hypothetical protein